MAIKTYKIKPFKAEDISVYSIPLELVDTTSKDLLISSVQKLVTDGTIEGLKHFLEEDSTVEIEYDEEDSKMVTPLHSKKSYRISDKKVTQTRVIFKVYTRDPFELERITCNSKVIETGDYIGVEYVEEGTEGKDLICVLKDNKEDNWKILYNCKPDNNLKETGGADKPVVQEVKYIVEEDSNGVFINTRLFKKNESNVATITKPGV